MAQAQTHFESRRYFWRWLVAWLAGAAMLLALAFQFRWPAIWEHISNLPNHLISGWDPKWPLTGLLRGMLVIFACLVLGDLITHFRRLRVLAIAGLLGAVILSFFQILAICTDHPFLGLMLLIFLFLVSSWILRKRRGAEKILRRWCRPLLSSGKFPLLIIICLCLIIAIYGLAPASESDELRYHLSTPAIWKRLGHISYLPYQAFSNFPMTSEMLFMLAMKGDNTGGAKLLHVFFYAICTALVGLLARRASGLVAAGFPQRREFAWAAALGFATLPFAPILAGWGFVDFFMTAFWLAFVYLGLETVRSSRRTSYVVMGLAAAGALGTKYSMLPQIGIAGAVWTIFHFILHKSLRSTIGASLMAAFCAIFFSSPWFIKNWINTGNPLYPLAWGIFGGGEWSTQHMAFYLAKAHEQEWHITGWPAPLARLFELLFSPFITALGFNRIEGHYIGSLPFMALCFGAAGFRLPQNKFRRIGILWLWLMLGLAWVLWFFTYQSNRMLLPAIGIALPLGAAGTAHLWMGLAPLQQKLTKYLYYAAISFSLLVYCTIMAKPSHGRADRIDAILAGLGLQPHELYLARSVNYYRAAQWANKHLAPQEKLLLVGEHRTLYFNMFVIASDWFDTPQPLPWLRASRSNGEMLNSLSAARVRYILLNIGELGLYYQKFWLKPFAGIPPRVAADEYARIAIERDPDGKFLSKQTLWNNPRLELVYEDALNQVLIYKINREPKD
jgi:hypothetical protein